MGAASQGCGVQGEGETASEAVRDGNVAAGEETRRHEAHGGAGGGQRGGPHAAPRPRGVRAWPSAGQRGLHRGTATRGGQPEAFAGRGLRAPEAGFGSAREQRGRRGRSCLRAESRTRGVDRRSGLHPAAAQRERWAVERSIPGSWQGRAPIRGARRSPWRKDAHEALPTCCPPVRTRRDGHGIGAREPAGPG